MKSELRVAVCSRSFSKNEELRTVLSNKFAHVKFNDKGLSLNGESLIAYLEGYEGAVIALEYVTEEVLARLPDLKFIGKYGVGLGKLDLDAMQSHDVKLGWTPGVNAIGVAELTLTMAISGLRNISMSNRMVLDGEWRQISGGQLSNKVYGIVGCGHVGKSLVKMLTGFGCTILVNDIVDYPDFYAEHGVQAVSLDELLAQSDVVSVHTPLNQTTRHLIDEHAIYLMKNSAIVINTARGGIIDENALLGALDSGKIGAAGLDVLENEPPNDRALIEHPRCFVTGHIGGSSSESVRAMGLAAIKGLEVHQDAQYFKQFL